MDDRELLKMFLCRDESAISETEKAYGELCFNLAFRILGDEHYAKECVNDALLRLWETIPPNEPRVLGAYAVSLTRNIALNRYREFSAKKRGGGFVEVALSELGELASHMSSPEDELVKKELVLHIDRFINDLPERKRRIFIEKYVYFLSDAEIAQREGRTRGSVRSELSRIRKKLKAYLEAEGYWV